MKKTSDKHALKVFYSVLFLFLSVGQLYGYDDVPHWDAWTLNEFYLADGDYEASGMEGMISEDNFNALYNQVQTARPNSTHVTLYMTRFPDNILCATEDGGCACGRPGSITFCDTGTSCEGTWNGVNCHYYPGSWQATVGECSTGGGGGQYIGVVEVTIYSNNIHNPGWDTDGDGVVDEDDPSPSFDDPDLDNDGIRDELDPYPDDPSPLDMQCVMVGFDSSEEACYWIMYDQSSGEYIQIGDSTQVDGAPVQNVPPINIDNQTYLDMFGEDSPYESEEITDNSLAQIDMEIGADPTSGSDPNAITGVSSAGNVTELDHLEDVVNNTNAEVANQNLEIDYLRSINERLGNLQQQNVTNNYSTVNNTTNEDSGEGEPGEMPTAEEIGDAVNDALNENDAPTVDTSSIDTAIAGFNDATSHTDTLDDLPNEDHKVRETVDDRAEEIETELETASDPIRGTEVTAVGNCSLSWNYNGSTIEMGVCGYESQLQAWGTVILMLCGLHCILIVFRK